MSMKRIVATNAGAVAARLTPPGKDHPRWGASVDGRSATGDTVEEACDNLAELLNRKGGK